MKIYYLLFSLVLVSCSSQQRTPLKNSKSKTVVAHRGASGYLPEHTLEAYSMAHAFNVDYIEPDLVMTKDNQIVIMHDIHLDKTTNVKEIFPKRKRKDGQFYVIDFTLAELKKLSLHERLKGKRFPNKKANFEIPTFIEFIELIQGLNKSRNKNIGIIPEIKSPEFHLKEKKDITKKVLSILKRYGYEKNGMAIIQCFYAPTLKRIKFELKSNISLFQLIAENSWGETSTDYDKLMSEQGIKDIATYADGIGPWYPQLEKKPLVKWAHQNGLKVIPYTHRVDDLPLMMSNKSFLDKLFIDQKIDGIFSDFSDTVMEYLSRN